MTETEKNQIHEKHHATDRTNITKNPPINDELFARELHYQVCLAITEGLLRLGLVTYGEAHKAKELLLTQYRPPIGTLLAEAG